MLKSKGKCIIQSAQEIATKKKKKKEKERERAADSQRTSEYSEILFLMNLYKTNVLTFIRPAPGIGSNEDSQCVLSSRDRKKYISYHFHQIIPLS